MSAENELIDRNTLGVLRPGPFRRFIIGSVISDTGTWMQVTAQAYVMSTLTNKALLLGMVQFAAGLPMLALTMIGGSAADRFDKRRILLSTQYVQIALAVAIGTSLMTGHIAIWQIFIAASLLGISNSFEMPAISALVPELVKHEEIASAVAIDRAVFHGSRVVGPALAGICIRIWGAASAFFGNAISFVALIIALISLPARPIGTPEEEEQRGSGIKEGFRYVAKDKPSLAMIALIATTTVCIFPILTVMMPLYVKNILGLGGDRLGYLLSGSAIGSVVGSILLLRVPRDRRPTVMMVCVGMVTCAIFGLSRTSDFAVATALLVVNSLGLSMNFGLANTIVQERAPNYLRGRVSAVFTLSFVGLMPIAGLGITGISDLIGMRSALAIGAVIYGLIGFFVLARVRRQCIVRPPSVVEVEPPPAVAAI
jgi:MFS family permease